MARGAGGRFTPGRGRGMPEHPRSAGRGYGMAGYGAYGGYGAGPGVLPGAAGLE